MRFVCAWLVALVALGCSSEIGDECVVSSDCSPNGDRFCDTASRGGYCTIQGCDYNTCPGEATCVRFFTGSFSNRTCDPAAPREQQVCTQTGQTNCCTLDELCSLVGSCVPRSSEIRFCMRKCDGNGDCRDGYECRDLALMMAHGGEPVLAPGVLVDASAPKFCASAPR